jgi:hypothetical protein
MTPILCTAFLIPIVADAAHVFIWNYDPLDVYFDSEVGDTVDGAYWLEYTLNAHGHTVVTDAVLPHNLEAFDMIFATLGWFRC